MKDSFDNDFEASLKIRLDPLVERFFSQTDYAAASRRAVQSDLYKFRAVVRPSQQGAASFARKNRRRETRQRLPSRPPGCVRGEWSPESATSLVRRPGGSKGLPVGLDEPPPELVEVGLDGPPARRRVVGLEKNRSTRGRAESSTSLKIIIERVFHGFWLQSGQKVVNSEVLLG